MKFLPAKMEVFVRMKKMEVSNVPVQLAIQVWCVLGKVIIVYVKFTNLQLFVWTPI